MNIQESFPEYDFVIIPGLNGSGPLHWQSIWEQENPTFVRVQQADWDHPIKDIWVETLVKTLENNSKPMVIIAHSLGVATFLHAFEKINKDKIAAAFLVAMPDINRPDLPKEIIGFENIPETKLAIPTLFVASEDDHYITIEESKRWSHSLAAKFKNIGKRGHIGTAANLGAWEEGKALLLEFLKSL